MSSFNNPDKCIIIILFIINIDNIRIIVNINKIKKFENSISPLPLTYVTQKLNFLSH